MALNNFVKTIQNIMRNDAGVNGDAQRIEQMVWMLFLKVYDSQEEQWELEEDNYESIIPPKYRWSTWAVDRKDGKAMTGTELLDFVNNQLFPTLKDIPVDEYTPLRKSIVKYAFADNNNYMKDGTLLRQVINEIDTIDLDDSKERHAFGEIYETILKDLQSAGHAGEFYTPRAVTDFIVEMVAPKLGESIADFACGTGGFLTSTLNALHKQAKTARDREKFNSAVFGIEKKALPYLLCATNMLLHGVSQPRIIHGNSLERNVRDYEDKDRFDVIVMNPPYGGSEKEIIKQNFPPDLRSSETADLFMAVIMYRLKTNGRAAVILPDGFLFGTDGAKLAIKQKLLTEFNLHTIVRLPGSVFAPYTSITTNILFFDKTGKTEKTWYYRLDMPNGYKHFSKTKPMRLEHFDSVKEWWNDRKEITVDGFDKAKCFTAEQLAELNFNLDQCGFPHKEEEILDPIDLILQYQEERASLNANIDRVLNKIISLISG